MHTMVQIFCTYSLKCPNTLNICKEIYIYFQHKNAGFQTSLIAGNMFAYILIRSIQVCTYSKYVHTFFAPNLNWCSQMDKYSEYMQQLSKFTG